MTPTQSKMELFVTTADSFEPLTFVTRSSIFMHVTGAFDLPLPLKPIVANTGKLKI